MSDFKAGFLRIIRYPDFAASLCYEEWVHIDTIESVSISKYPRKPEYLSQIETKGVFYQLIYCTSTVDDILEYIDSFRKELLP